MDGGSRKYVGFKIQGKIFRVYRCFGVKGLLSILFFDEDFRGLFERQAGMASAW